MDEPLPESSGPAARRLSEDLQELLRQAAGRSLTVGELEEILEGRGFALFILLFSLPFVFPIPTPGLSVIFGVIIAFMGIRIAMGLKPSLPGFILKRELKYSLLEKIIKIGLRLCNKMEKVVKPRLHFFLGTSAMLKLIGLGIASGGVQLCLPLPPVVPLSNTIPAISVLLLTAGMVERDGLLVLLGYLVNVAAWIYFGFMFALLGGVIRSLLHYLGY